MTPRGVGLFGRAEPVPGDKPTKGANGGGRGARVCVSGVEVAIPESLALEASGGVDGATASRSVVSGQLVFVEAVRTDDGLVARRVVLAGDGAGRLEGRTEDGAWIVDGRRLRIGPDTARDPALEVGALRPGRWIAFQAQLGPDGELVVTRIAPGREGRTRAPDTRLESELPERLREGRKRGRIDYAAVEGYVARTGARTRVGRVALSLPARRAGPPERVLRPGARVRVGGRIELDGALRPMPVRPRLPRPSERLAPPSDRPERPRVVPERPPREDARPPARPVRPKAPRDVPRGPTRSKIPTVDRAPTR